MKSDRKSHGREMGESDLKGCERQGRRQVRRARFINNGRMVGNDEHKESSDVIGPNSEIEAKHSRKALRRAYKQVHKKIEHKQDL